MQEKLILQLTVSPLKPLNNPALITISETLGVANGFNLRL